MLNLRFVFLFLKLPSVRSFWGLLSIVSVVKNMKNKMDRLGTYRRIENVVSWQPRCKSCGVTLIRRKAMIEGVNESAGCVDCPQRRKGKGTDSQTSVHRTMNVSYVCLMGIRPSPRTSISHVTTPLYTVCHQLTRAVTISLVQSKVVMDWFVGQSRVVMNWFVLWYYTIYIIKNKK